MAIFEVWLIVFSINEFIENQIYETLQDKEL
jgi:hypothetical protein